MLFNSIYYAFFLPLVVALYWAAPRRVRYRCCWSPVTCST